MDDLIERLRHQGTGSTKLELEAADALEAKDAEIVKSAEHGLMFANKLAAERVKVKAKDAEIANKAVLHSDYLSDITSAHIEIDGLTAQVKAKDAEIHALQNVVNNLEAERVDHCAVVEAVRDVELNGSYTSNVLRKALADLDGKEGK